MVNIVKKLNEAYKLLSSLSVSGDAVDVIAVVRSHLREASAKLSEMCSTCTAAEEKEEANGQTD